MFASGLFLLRRGKMSIKREKCHNMGKNVDNTRKMSKNVENATKRCKKQSGRCRPYGDAVCLHIIDRILDFVIRAIREFPYLLFAD